ncbi:acyl-homoserine-lactone synthase [Gemmobacter sp. 24YEA27]|uniref:acyl-homoserine-lactone synthase n=1 Tax=Gemmobacter sp. 24YEA27 TaxID=3040672 RepID=UPI0024B36014|nr:acyl-homoserine-lactone synthase [Gemmobacter sp. 24YEA27]
MGWIPKARSSPASVCSDDRPAYAVRCVSEILDGEAPLRSSRIWESTRFCVDTARLSGTGPNHGFARATCELMVATLETCRNAGSRTSSR